MWRFSVVLVQTPPTIQALLPLAPLWTCGQFKVICHWSTNRAMNENIEYHLDLLKSVWTQL